MVLGFEGDQDIAIACAERADIAEGQIEAAERYSDVVDNGVDFARWDDAADLIVDFGK
jgi:hypothetical protein